MFHFANLLKRGVFLVALLICSYYGNARSRALADTLRVSKATPEINLMSYLNVYEDATTNLNIGEILRNDSLPFVANEKKGLNFGFNSQAHWVMFTVVNEGNTTLEYVLSINFPSINYVDIFDVVGTAVVRKVMTGELRDVNERDISSPNYALTVRLVPGQAHRLFVRVFNNGDSVSMPISFTERTLHAKNNFYDIVLSCLLLSLFLFMIIFTISYYIFTRDSLFRFYSMFLIFVCLSVFYLEGMLHFIITNNWFIDRSIYLFGIASTVCLLMFVRSFLSIRTHLPTMNFMFKSLAVLLLSSIVPLLFDYPVMSWAIVLVSFFLASVLPLVTLATIIMLIRYKYPLAVFLSVSLFMMLVGSSIHFSRDFGLIPSNLLTSKIITVTTVIDSFIMLFAIMYHIKTKQEEANRNLVQQNRTITEQKNMLELSKLELEKLSYVISKVDSGVGMYNEKGDLIWINTGFENIHGIHFNDMKNQSYHISSFYDNSMIDNMLRGLSRDKESISFETEAWNSRKNKSVVIQTSLSQVFNENTSLRLFVTIDTDISHVKKIQNELLVARDKAEEANRLKSAFIANISHELRTPLNAINGFSQVLMMREVGREKMMHFLSLINHNGIHLLDLINDVIDVSKLESGQLEVNNGPFRLDELLSDIGKLISGQMGDDLSKSVTFSIDNKLSPQQCNIVSDMVKLRHLLLILLKNSVKFTSHGHISLSCFLLKDDAEKLLFVVEDSGIGLTPGEIDIAFQRFRQVDDSTSRKYSGTGLGLTMAKSIVTLMKGRIWIESEKGKFTRVMFTIPYMKGLSMDKGDNQRRVGISRITEPKTILVIEADESQYQVLDEILKTENLTILRAKRGSEAVPLIKATNNCSLVLFDVDMKDTSIYDTIRELKMAKENLNIVAITSFSTQGFYTDCMDAGCCDMLLKPVPPDEMIQVMYKYI